MNQLHFTCSLILAVVVIISSSHQLSVEHECELNNFYSNVLRKLDELKECTTENATTFQKALSEQAEAIQQLKSKQESSEGTSDKMHALLEESKGSLQRLSQQVLNLVDTVQQLQQKQTKTEEALNKNIQSIRLLVDSSELNLGQQLMSAVKDGDTKQVNFLLELGAPVEYQDSDKNRPIHVAVQKSRPKILEILLENKADIASKGIYEQTALNMAGYSNCVECARILLDKGANIGARDKWGNSPMVHPARAGHKEFIELLLARGASINEAQSVGITGLHWAARDGRLPIVKFLIEKGADVKLKTLAGKTPLDEAIAHNHTAVADYLRSILKSN